VTLLALVPSSRTILAGRSTSSVSAAPTILKATKVPSLTLRASFPRW
jgi:hypothetical protein